jgi:hypothetical protein
MTVLLLGIAVNFEPTRIGWVALMLTRKKPLLQLMAFSLASLTMSLGFGIFFLFISQPDLLQIASFDGGRTQIVIGAVALAISSIMALHWVSTRRHHHAIFPDFDASAQKAQPRPSAKYTDWGRRILQKGSSPWGAGLVGIGSGLPSVDYLAVLAIIATADTTPSQKAAALITFVLMGSLLILAVLLGFLMAPYKTLDVLDRLGFWIRSRSQIEYAGLLAVVGCLLIGLSGGSP